MVTRTRKPKATPAKETAKPEAEFDPQAIHDGSPEDDVTHDEATTPPKFLRGQENPEDSDGDIADGEQVFDPDSGEDDPSASQPLGRTVTGMSQGQQAAEAEVKEYIRRRLNLMSEAAEVKADIAELDREFKNKGYDMVGMKLLTKIEGLDEKARAKRREQNIINETYATAAGIDLDLL